MNGLSPYQNYAIWFTELSSKFKEVTLNLQRKDKGEPIAYTAKFITKSTFWKSFLKGQMDEMLGFSTRNLNNVDQMWLLAVVGDLWSDLIATTEAVLAKEFFGLHEEVVYEDDAEEEADPTKLSKRRSRYAHEQLAAVINENYNNIVSTTAVREYFESDVFATKGSKWSKEAKKLRKPAPPAPPAPPTVSAPSPLELVVGVPVVERLVGVLAPEPAPEATRVPTPTAAVAPAAAAPAPAAAPELPPVPAPPPMPTPPPVASRTPTAPRKRSRGVPFLEPPPITRRATKDLRDVAAPPAPVAVAVGNDALLTKLTETYKHCRERARLEKATLFPQGVVRANLDVVDGFAFYTTIRTNGKSTGGTDTYVEVLPGTRAARIAAAADKSSAKFRSGPGIGEFFQVLARKGVNVASIA
jgi:hypothetical protein